MSNVTPIKPPARTMQFPDSLKQAIEEQQSRVWRLRNLIEAVNRASETNEVEDIAAAFSGIVEYADCVHMALDVGTLAERASVLEAESNKESQT